MPGSGTAAICVTIGASPLLIPAINTLISMMLLRSIAKPLSGNESTPFTLGRFASRTWVGLLSVTTTLPVTFTAVSATWMLSNGVRSRLSAPNRPSETPFAMPS